MNLYHALAHLARLSERPDRALGELHARERILLALMRIGRQQIVERRRPFRALDVRDRLGLTASKDIAAKLRPRKHLLGRSPDRFEPLEAQRQRVRHVLGALPFRRVHVRQQQARLEIGEPGRHHQIVGRELQAQPPRLLNEGEILVGERQDRDLGKVDLLLAGERKQEIERPFEALHIDHERLLAGGKLGRELTLGLDVVGGHDALRAPARQASSSMPASFRRASASSIALGAARADSAAAARLAAAPRSTGAAPATASISASSPLQWRTMSQPAASAARVRSAIEPDSAPIDTSSLISSPLNPIESRITSCTIVTEVVAGLTGS